MTCASALSSLPLSIINPIIMTDSEASFSTGHSNQKEKPNEAESKEYSEEKNIEEIGAEEKEKNKEEKTKNKEDKTKNKEEKENDKREEKVEEKEEEIVEEDKKKIQDDVLNKEELVENKIDQEDKPEDKKREKDKEEKEENKEAEIEENKAQNEDKKKEEGRKSEKKEEERREVVEENGLSHDQNKEFVVESEKGKEKQKEVEEKTQEGREREEKEGEKTGEKRGGEKRGGEKKRGEKREDERARGQREQEKREGGKSEGEKREGEDNKESHEHKEDNLEQEVRYRETVRWSVNILEQSVEELEAQLEALENEEDEEETEFKLRFEAQRDLNDKLEEQIKWYNHEVLKMKERNKKGNEYKHDADLEAMTESELGQLVKQLERERNNLYGDLRNKSWLLDNQSKEYYHHKELIKAYTGDLNHINRSLEQIWRTRSRSRDSASTAAGLTPVTSPGAMNWSGESGIRPSHRILDPRKGPVRKTAGVRSLPRLDQKTLDEYDDQEMRRKKRTKSMSQARLRTKSVEVKRRVEEAKRLARGGGGGLDADSRRSAAEDEESDPTRNWAAAPPSDPSEDLTVESFSSSLN